MIVRHDVDPQLYLADSTQFPAVIAVNTCQEEIPIAYDNIDRMLKPSLIAESQMVPQTCDRTDGMGTLIHPNWLLTAGHVALELAADHTVKIADKSYSIAQTVIHPHFHNWSEELACTKNDIALIQLTQTVENVTPILLSRQHNELSSTMILLGSGDFGNGIIGPDRVDAKLRKATNRVEALDKEWLVFKFDPPPNTTELEGISGPGDNGGPALLQVGEKWAIAGISSSQDSGTLGEGRYGVLEYYTRVSQYVDWIESVIKNGRTA